ncbi:MAG: hypothetical protein OXC30_02435 [Alphaproteobacteria bacterium]|nr:hypothetical protein [Alphaproteobacteria bacterium]
MINIIQCFLFMILAYTDIAAAVSENWFTKESFASNYAILESNLTRHMSSAAADQSDVLQMCKKASKAFEKYGKPIPKVLRVDIGVLLHTLCQASCESSQTLFDTFFAEDNKVKSKAITTCEALGKCVPPFDIAQVTKALRVLSISPANSEGIVERYQKQGSARFSPKLLSFLGLESGPAGLARAPAACENTNWFAEVVLQHNYATLESNLTCHMSVVQSDVLQMCKRLSQVFAEHRRYKEDVCLLLCIDAGVVLHTLCRESERDPQMLSQMLCAEDNKIKSNITTKSKALGQCVPPVDIGKLKVALYPLCSPPNQLPIAQTEEIVYRYNAQKGSDRFSRSLLDFLGISAPAPQTAVCSASMSGAPVYHPNLTMHHQQLAYQQPVYQWLPAYPGLQPTQDPLKRDHVAAYVMRDVDVRDDPKLYGWVDKILIGKISVRNEITGLLLDMKRTMTALQNNPYEVAGTAFVVNACARLDVMIGFLQTNYVTDREIALLYVWAFLMERKGASVVDRNPEQDSIIEPVDARMLYNLGLSRAESDALHRGYITSKTLQPQNAGTPHHLWLECRDDFPKYLYVLAEGTDVESLAGVYMRNYQTKENHQCAKYTRHYDLAVNYPKVVNKYNVSSKWWPMIGFDNYAQSCEMLTLFEKIFAHGDAPGIR